MCKRVTAKLNFRLVSGEAYITQCDVDYMIDDYYKSQNKYFIDLDVKIIKSY